MMLNLMPIYQENKRRGAFKRVHGRMRKQCVFWEEWVSHSILWRVEVKDRDSGEKRGWLGRLELLIVCIESSILHIIWDK